MIYVIFYSINILCRKLCILVHNVVYLSLAKFKFNQIHILHHNKNIIRIISFLCLFCCIFERESSSLPRIKIRPLQTRIFRFKAISAIDQSRWWLPAGHDRERRPCLSVVRDHARCPANRYVLINASLPHSPGAITAIITGPRIFSARGLHTQTRRRRW